MMLPKLVIVEGKKGFLRIKCEIDLKIEVTCVYVYLFIYLFITPVGRTIEDRITTLNDTYTKLR
jgi:hypothetical protein